MQDLLEITHFLTRVKVAPGAEGFFDGGSRRSRARRRDGGQAFRAVADARLADAAQGPVRSARCDAADRGGRNGADPSCLCRRSSAYRQAGARSAGWRRRATAASARAVSACASRRAARARASHPASACDGARRTGAAAWPGTAPTLRTLEDIAALAQRSGASGPQSASRKRLHLVRLEPGQIEFRPVRARRARWRAISRRSSRNGPARAGW